MIQKIKQDDRAVTAFRMPGRARREMDRARRTGTHFPQQGETMPRIQQSLLIDAPVEHVYTIARDVESFPDIMEDLQSLVVLERSEDGNRTITEWVGIIREFKMTVKWTQEDRWDPARFRDDFRLLKGDMDSMSGCWQFTPEDGRTRFDSVVDYEYNVPLIGPMIKALIKKKMAANLNAQMQAIKRKAETPAAS
jgi:ribosome-associated toxin RatA of RatAB toxin-antitoxin module